MSMKKFLYLLISLFSFGGNVNAESSTIPEQLYDIHLQTIDGKDFPLSSFRGKVLLIVNTASRCGFTPQYKGLEALHKKYEAEGLVVLGIPSNDFGGQEPGEEKEIKNFCENTFGVSFPLTTKQRVKGENRSALYNFLIMHAPERQGKEVRWNFEKFLIDKDGQVRYRFASTVEPESEELLAALHSLL
jgi:glutathione peroxidase-family protein